MWHLFDAATEGSDSPVSAQTPSKLQFRLTLYRQTGFVVAFITFLGWCIDYSKISHSHKMSEVIVAKCTKKLVSPF